MPTPDIIVKFREKFGTYNLNDTAEYNGKLYAASEPIEQFILQALTDREAEIVAGIEGMKRNVVVRFGDRIVKPLNLERDIQWDAALHDIATKITNKEI